MDYGEHADVQEVHAAIQREKREPRVGLEPLSMWLIVVYGVAIFFGGAYRGRYSGSFSGTSGIVFRLWVTSSPCSPSPRVAPTVKAPLT